MNIEDKFYVNVLLVVCAGDTFNKDSRYVLLKSNLSIISNVLKNGETPESVVHRILYRLTGVTEYWGTVLPYGIIDVTNDEINILYATFIPEKTMIRDLSTEWKSINRSNDFPELTKKALYEIAWRKV